MSDRKLLKELESLPKEARRQVVDFIAFLKRQATKATASGEADMSDISEDEFVGMWRHRRDLEDSTAWVRRLRRREWHGL